MCNINEWFDVENIHHIRAWKELSDTGAWPDNFIPKGMEFPLHWHVFLVGKMANAWVEDMLDTCEVL